NVTAIPSSMGSVLRRKGWSARANTNGITGRMHGLNMVSTPPKNAKTNKSIGLSPLGWIANPAFCYSLARILEAGRGGGGTVASRRAGAPPGALCLRKHPCAGGGAARANPVQHADPRICLRALARRQAGADLEWHSGGALGRSGGGVEAVAGPACAGLARGMGQRRDVCRDSERRRRAVPRPI